MRDLRCEKLRKCFDGIAALDDVGLRFPPSQITAVIGPNGAGKTTLLNVLSGFIRPDGGHCFFGTREITRLPPHQIAQLGIARTFQDLRLIFQTAVLENVVLACPHQRGEGLLAAILRVGLAREEAQNSAAAMEILKFVGLDTKATDLAEELSYGEQKLLTLACCLAMKTEVLLLDEPVAGVHPDMISRVLGLLSRLRDQRKTLVLVEHNISAVREIADLIIVMDEGRIVAQGPPCEILERPEIIEAYLG